MGRFRRPVLYSLVILAPGSDEDELFRVSSDRPFWPVRVGDEVLPRRWLGGRDDRDFTLAGVLLRVTKVRHVVALGDDRNDHQVVVFTEDISPDKGTKEKP
jgi:hypothetical protein